MKGNIQELLDVLAGKPGKQQTVTIAQEWVEVKDLEDGFKLRGVTIMPIYEDGRLKRLRFEQGDLVYMVTMGGFDLTVREPKQEVQDVWLVSGDPLPGLFPPVDLMFPDELSAARAVKAYEEKGFSLNTEKKSMTRREVEEKLLATTK